MGYEAALIKAWGQLKELSEQENFSVRFLADEYSVDSEKKEIFSLSCNIPAKTHTAILILHYLIKKMQALLPAQAAGKWISFKELEGGEPYYLVLKKRTIDVIVRKHGKNPKGLFEAAKYLRAKKAAVSEYSVVLEPFERAVVLVEVWPGDDEFGPEANILFDETIKDIFCTEDIVVMSEIIAHSI
mgnify:CR=1 FL=1